MSFRPRADKTQVATSPDRLSHVLNVGMGKTAPSVVLSFGTGADADLVLSEAGFMAEFMRIVEADAMNIAAMDFGVNIDGKPTAEQMKKTMIDKHNRVVREAKKHGEEFVQKSRQGMNKAADRAKRLANGASLLTKKSAAALLEDFKRRYQGASRSVHWSTTDLNTLAMLLKANYRKSFSERTWKNIVAGNNNDRFFYSETGGNCHAKITIDDIDERDQLQRGKLTVYAFITMTEEEKRMLGDNAEKVKIWGKAELDLGNLTQMNATTHKQIMERIDNCITAAISELKAKWKQATHST